MNPLLSREWLGTEIERIWLTVELELRRLQRLQLRPVSAETEIVLAERRAVRTGASAPYDAEELRAATTAILDRLDPLRRPAVARLRTRLGLSFSDIDALLLLAAPSIDPALADVFAAVRGAGVAHRGMDAALMSQLLSYARGQRLDLLALLDEHRPPLAHRLIQCAPARNVAGSPSFRSIEPTLDLLWLLSASGDTVSPALRDHATVVRTAASWDGLLLDDHVRFWTEQLARLFELRTAPLPWVALCGAAGSGKRTIASRLAAHAKRSLLVFAPRVRDKAQLLELVRIACRDAAWLNAALYLGPFATDELNDQPMIMSALEKCRQPVLLGFGATQPPRLKTTRPLGEYTIPVPQMPIRLALWKRALGTARMARESSLAGVALRYLLTPGEIGEGSREARMLAGAGPIDDALLRRVMERRLRNELGDIATRLEVSTTWDDVILPSEAIGRIRELVARKRHEDRVYREWGLDRKIGYGKGLVALFSGPSGTGKTLLAGVIARELGYELYQIDLSRVMSRWIGETEKALDKGFDQAERAHAVLLFDEADALFAKRTEVEDSHDRYANVAVNFLLQRLERFSGIAVLTTNKDAYLDEALRRRLSLHLQIDKPELYDRQRLWQKHLPPSVPGSQTVDISRLAAEFELTGGYIKNIAVRAAFLAAAGQMPLTTDHVRRAARLELEDLGRVVTWPNQREAAPSLDHGDHANSKFDSDHHADYIEG